MSYERHVRYTCDEHGYDLTNKMRAQDQAKQVLSLKYKGFSNFTDLINRGKEQIAERYGCTNPVVTVGAIFEVPPTKRKELP